MLKTIKLSPLAMVVALVALAACAPAAPPSKPAASPAAKAVSKAEEERHAKLVEGAQKEGEVVIWTYLIRNADEALGPFKAKYPFLKVTVFDSRGPELLARITEERRAGRFTPDVLIMSSEIEDAHQQGFLEEYEFPNAQNWPNQPKHNFFRRAWAAYRIDVYNKDRVAAEDVPRSHEAMLEPKYGKYKFVATISGEDTPLFHAIMFGNGERVDWDRSLKYWTDLVTLRKPAVQTGYTQVLERLGAGEFDFFPAAVGDATMSLIKKGSPLAVAPTGTGVVEPSGAIGLAKNAPHPNAAKLWLDFYTTPQGNAAYVNALDAITYLGPEYERLIKANQTLGELGVKLVFVKPEFLTPENLKKSEEFYLTLLGVQQSR